MSFLMLFHEEKNIARLYIGFSFNISFMFWLENFFSEKFSERDL